MKILEKSPALLPSWLRALTGGRKSPSAQDLAAQEPRHLTRLLPQVFDHRLLGKYRRICGFAADGTLPMTWPQVAAGPLHVAMFTDPAFPVPAMGIVHVRNRIEQLQSIADTEAVELTTWLARCETVDQGTQVQVVTEATVAGELRWRSELTALVRGKSKTKKEKSPQSAQVESPSLRSVMVHVPVDMGRRYARVAGDWNPIHQYAWTAKAFGFPRAIAHGMWLLGRVLAESGDDLPSYPRVCEVHFRRPVLLPSTVALRTFAQPHGGIGFALLSRDGQTRHLYGSVQAL